MQEPKLLFFFNKLLRTFTVSEGKKNQIYSLIEAGLEIWF